MQKILSLRQKQPVWFNIILILLLVGGLFLLYNIFPVSAATISLKPAIHHYSDTQTIYFRPVGATKDKDAVDMTTLTVAKTQKKDVPTTGKQEVKAIPAQGTIILSNFQGSFPKRNMMIHFISIRAKNGSTFLLDPFYFREGTTIPVSALVGGEQGNIPAHYLDGVYIFSSAMFVSASNAPDGPVYNQNSELFTGDSTVYIQNPKPFTGGKDSSTFPVVYHQDLEDVKKSFEETLTLQAQSDLAKQVTGGKHIVPGSPIECKTTTTSQPTIGQPATRTSVTVLVTCSTNIYDQKNLLATTTKLQEAELAKSYGPGYVPHGEPEIKYGKAGSKDVKIDDTLKTYTTLTLVRSGNWIYNINPQQMAQDFAGKPLWWVNRELGTMDDLLSYSVASSGIGGALLYSSSNINVEVMR